MGPISRVQVPHATAEGPPSRRPVARRIRIRIKARRKRRMWPAESRSGPLVPPQMGHQTLTAVSGRNVQWPSTPNKESGMDTPAQYFDLSFIHISYPNLIVIGLMIVLFAVALVAPFPHGSDRDA